MPEDANSVHVHREETADFWGVGDVWDLLVKPYENPYKNRFLGIFLETRKLYMVFYF